MHADAGIAEMIEEHLPIWPKATEAQFAEYSHEVGADVVDSYFQYLQVRLCTLTIVHKYYGCMHSGTIDVQALLNFILGSYQRTGWLLADVMFYFMASWAVPGKGIPKQGTLHTR